jgi:hypothetical protein
LKCTRNSGSAPRNSLLCLFLTCLGGGIGRHTGLKILRWVKLAYEFDSRPRHQIKYLTLKQSFAAKLLANSREVFNLVTGIGAESLVLEFDKNPIEGIFGLVAEGEEPAAYSRRVRATKARINLVLSIFNTSRSNRTSRLCRSSTSVRQGRRCNFSYQLDSFFAEFPNKTSEIKKSKV